MVKTRRLVLAIVAMFPWVPVLAAQSRSARPPVTFPFAAHRAGAIVTAELRIVEHRIYWLDLVFYFNERDPEDRKRVRKLTGDHRRGKDGKLLEPGISVPLKLKIEALASGKETTLLEKEVSEHALSTWSANYFSKRIDQIELTPGRYRITVQSLKDIPELDDTGVSIGVAFHALSTPISR